MNAGCWRWEPLAERHEDAVLALWNRELGRAFPLRSRLLRQNVTGHPDLLPGGSLVAIDATSGELAGVVACKRPVGSVGHLTLLLVGSEYRCRGLGGTLLGEAENALRQQGAAIIVFGGDNGHLVPGIPAECVALAEWLERHGYRRGESSHDLLGDFRNGRSEAAGECVPPGVKFALAEEAELAPLLDFLHAHFPGRWEDSTRLYRDAGGTGREFVLARREGELIGFCRINDDHTPVLAANQFWTPCFAERAAGIGPFGIAGAWRGQGYGRAMLEAGVRELVGRGIRLIVIDWTSAVEFYAKAGFSIWKTYLDYLKAFKDG